MPEYLAPGVYVEETSFRAKSIEGVSTSTAAFVGPTGFGPIQGEPQLVTSYAEFERIYAGLDQLQFHVADNQPLEVHPNFMAHGVRGFFEEGGRRLYMDRVFKPKSVTDDGRAFLTVPAAAGDNDPKLLLIARYPGAAANVPVTFSFQLGQNILGEELSDPSSVLSAKVSVLRGAGEYDVVAVIPVAGDPVLYWLKRVFDNNRYTFDLMPTAGDTAVKLSTVSPATDQVRILTVNVTVGRLGQFGHEQAFPNLAFHPEHPHSLRKVFAKDPANRATALYVPVVDDSTMTNGAAIATLLLAEKSLSDKVVGTTLGDNKASDADRMYRKLMAGGNDGARPGAAEYEGTDAGDAGKEAMSGFKALETVEDISIVAAPGSTYAYTGTYGSESKQVIRLLIGHAERMRYRIAVVDSPDQQLITDIRAFRAQLDSSHAALYYPWVKILDPVTRRELFLPPSGFVSGIYARNDVETGVHKAPANEVVRSAIGFELAITQAQQDVLNPEGINCFRFFPGRGYRLWGARTISSDPEWKYVNLRRYFAYLERSIDKGTQWVVFMNNSEGLWANVQRTLEDFLFNEWKSERLMGTKPEEAYFVRCDRSTMTQNDLDNGRLICLVGVSPVRPAEFVIFRIGQWTADRRS